jgi:periplasmic divalent cation tolerance protein
MVTIVFSPDTGKIAHVLKNFQVLSGMTPEIHHFREILMSRYLQVVTTVENREDADKIAADILGQRLAGCIQISSCRSMYHWQGSLASSDEFVLVMKTRADLFTILSEAIRRIHPYEVPEILATEIVHGDKPYLDWLDAELAPLAD